MGNCTIPRQLFGSLIVILLSLGQVFSAPAGRWKPAQALPKASRSNSVLVRSLESSQSEIVLEYAMPEVSMVRLKHTKVGTMNCERVSMGNALHSSKAGEPVVPFVPVKLVLPQGYTIDRIETKSLVTREIAGTHIIEYGQLPRPLDYSIPYTPAVPNPEIYNSDKPYPRNNYKLVTIQKKYGVSIAFINLFPVALFPKSGKVIQSTGLKVAVYLKKDPGAHIRELAVRPELIVPERIGIENPEMITTYTSREPTVPCKSTLCRTREDATCLIIARDAVINASISPSLCDLLDFRKTQGFTGKIVPYEEAIASVNGEDDEVKLREFIKSAYNNWKTRYVFLAGAHGGSNETTMLSKKLYISIVPDATIGGYRLTDFYNQCLDGDYNFNKSDEEHAKKYGEWDDGENGGIPDMMAEVAIGRIYSRNAEDISNAVYKILTYEQSNHPYTREVLLAGEAIFDAEKHDKEMWYAKNSIMLVWDGCSESKGLKEIQGLNKTDLFDADVCNYMPPPKPPELDLMGWEADEMVEKINSNKYGYINHLGHGNWEHGLDIDVPVHTDQINNTNYFFVYSQACLNGSAVNPEANISQRLTAANRYGAWGGVFNTAWGYAPYKGEGLTGPSERMHLQFWDAYVSENIKLVGDMNADSHEDNIPFVEEHHIRYCMAITMLFGDPASKIKFSDATPIEDEINNNFPAKADGDHLSIRKISSGRVNLVVRGNGSYTVGLYNMSGKLVEKFKIGKYTAGAYTVDLHSRALSGGIYFLQIKGRNKKFVKQLVLMK